MHPTSLRAYATAATRWAIDMEEKLEKCNVNIREIVNWFDSMENPTQQTTMQRGKSLD